MRPPDSSRAPSGPSITALLLAGLLVLGGCDALTSSNSPPVEFDMTCSVPVDRIMDGGVGTDGIPSLDNPNIVSASTSPSYVLPGDGRVVGIEIDGEHLAVSHNLLWWHEVVNIDHPSGLRIAITYCPLTGSALVFDRSPFGGATLGVSGLLFQNNLMMYDRTGEPSLWVQMGSRAVCGPNDGTRLTVLPSLEMTWDAWQELYPEGYIVAFETGFDMTYRHYPYGNYESLQSTRLIFPQSNEDDRRLMKERVLGIPAREGTGGVAFPFLELDAGPTVMEAVHWTSDGESLMVLWDGEAEAAAAYRTEVDGQTLTFTVEEDLVVDQETGSTWRVDGRAISGPLEGHQLEPVARAYVAFWFAWNDFQPDTEVWERP